MMHQLEDLLSAGYEVTFTSPLKDTYEAVVTGPSGDAVIGTGDSAAGALQDAAASCWRLAGNCAVCGAPLMAYPGTDGAAIRWHHDAGPFAKVAAFLDADHAPEPA